MIAYLDVKLSEISSALSHCNAATQFVILSNIDILVCIKDGLFPVRILLVWTSAQKNRSSKITEWGVKPGN